MHIDVHMNILSQGMAFYVGKDLGQGTVTSKDYDLYCHFGTCSYINFLCARLMLLRSNLLSSAISCVHQEDALLFAVAVILH
jgi:hypothetical protein